jgi:hypothetical protein
LTAQHEVSASAQQLLDYLVGASGGAAQVDHVWLLDEDVQGQVLTDPPQTCGPNRIYFVDLYARGQLMCFIPANGYYTSPQAHRMLALDSNMFTGLTRYVLDGERNTVSVSGIEQLIEYAIVQQYGVLPIPYLKEAIIHNGIEGARRYCEAIYEAVLRLRYIDAEVFRSAGCLRYTEAALGRLEEEHGTRDFRTAAIRASAELLEQPLPVRSHYFISYLVVLALIEIGILYNDIETRVSTFDEVLLNQVGGLYPRFMLLARLFFYGKISQWLRIAPGSSKYTANGVRAAGYDVSLTMLNEEGLQLSSPTDPDVLMLVTHDRELSLYAPLIRLKGMSLLRDGNVSVLNPWDEARLDSAFGALASSIRNDIDAKLSTARSIQVPPATIIALIRDYEQRLQLPPSRLSSLQF